MRSKEEKQEALAKLSEPQKNVIKGAIKDLEYFLNHHETISHEGYQHLKGVLNSISVFTETYITSLINLIKQGHELD